jgi:hypothetical protein
VPGAAFVVVGDVVFLIPLLLPLQPEMLKAPTESRSATRGVNRRRLGKASRKIPASVAPEPAAYQGEREPGWTSCEFVAVALCAAVIVRVVVAALPEETLTEEAEKA